MPDNEDANRHYTESTYREMIVETLFLGELLRHLWSVNAPTAEVLRSMRDNGGYDLVIGCGGATRFIQLKGMTRRKSVRVNQRLAEKTGACVIGMILNPETLEIRQTLWLGGSVNQKIPIPAEARPARSLYYNRNGDRAFLQNTMIVPGKCLEPVKGTAELIQKLFNIPPTSNLL